MKVNIAQWNKYKNRIADELYGEPFDWLSLFNQGKIVLEFQKRLKNGSI